MESYVGPVVLGTTNYVLACQTTDANGTPQTATTDAVAYRIYAPGGSSALLTGSFQTTVIDSQTGLYQTGSLAITGANGFASGNTYMAVITYAYSGVTYVRVQYFTVT